MHYFGLGFLLLFLSSGVHGINPFQSRNQGQLQQLKIVADQYQYSDDDISDAAPAIQREEAADEDSDSSEDAKDDANLQFMITNRMRRVLEDDLNYHIEEIEVMDPQIASVVIERGLARPPTGMPKAWQSIKPSKTLSSDMRKVIINFIKGVKSRVHSSYRATKKVVTFTVKKVLPIVIPTIGVIYYLPKVVSLGMRVGASLAGSGGGSSRRMPVIRKLNTGSQSEEQEPRIRATLNSKKSVDNDLIISLNENRIDMKALNEIVRPRSIIEKLFGR